MKKIFSIIVLGIFLVGAGCNTETVNNSSSTTSTVSKMIKLDLEVMQSSFAKLNTITFEYPEGYTAGVPNVSFPALQVIKKNTGKLEIYQESDIPGGRTFGFEGTEDPKEVENDIEYAPKETLTTKVNGQEFSVWLFYKKGDEKTKEELHAILNSIKSR